MYLKENQKKIKKKINISEMNKFIITKFLNKTIIYNQTISKNINKVFGMEKGVCKWFNSRKGFGFITSSDGKDIFVHHSQIIANEGGFRSLNEGDEVEFEITQGQKGPQASTVKVTKKAPHSAPPRQQRPYTRQFNPTQRSNRF